MKTLVAFRISEFQQISIVINDQNKINTYGYKSNGLHVFDEVEVEYINSVPRIHGYFPILSKMNYMYLLTNIKIIINQY